MKIVVASAFAACVLAACTPAPLPLPPNASIGGAPLALPSPQAQANDAPPKILAMHFSSLDLVRPTTWSGEFVTSTNVASLEVRSNLFSINVPRTAFGRFAFTLDVLDVPPIFIRYHRLEVIARNQAGVEAEEDLSMRIH